MLRQPRGLLSDTRHVEVGISLTIRGPKPARASWDPTLRGLLRTVVVPTRLPNKGGG